MIAKPRSVTAGVGCALLLGFTLAGPARADDAQQQPCTPSDHTPPCGGPETSLSGIGGQQLVGGPGADTSYPELTGDDDATPASDADRHWVESPYAPHDTTGANLRLGSAVGRLIHDDHRYTALGVTVAGGPRMGRFTLEGHYTYLQLSAPGPSEQVFGSAHRVGLMGRADLVRLDSHIVGANALLAFYGEAGMMHELHRWLKPGVYERREVSRDGGRTGAVVGFGFNLDLRLEQPRGFPNRIGWQLGWQMTASDEHDPDPTMICKGVSCLMQTTATHGPTRDTSMLVTSTIAFTW